MNNAALGAMPPSPKKLRHGAGGYQFLSEINDILLTVAVFSSRIRRFPLGGFPSGPKGSRL